MENCSSVKKITVRVFWENHGQHPFFIFFFFIALFCNFKLTNFNNKVKKKFLSADKIVSMTNIYFDHSNNQ